MARRRRDLVAEPPPSGPSEADYRVLRSFGMASTDRTLSDRILAYDAGPERWPVEHRYAELLAFIAQLGHGAAAERHVERSRNFRLSLNDRAHAHERTHHG